MASLGTLAVNIVARTDKFTGGVTKTMGSLDKLSGHIVNVKSALGGLTAAFAVYASASYFKGLIDEFGELSDMAMSINTTREALQGLHHAAILSGVSTGKLDNSLQKLVVNVSKANATGKGSVFDAINELGLKTSELARLSPDEQLKKIAGAMGGVANHSDKARLAYTIFGKAGVSLLPMLKDGAAGLTRFQKEAESLGLVFSTSQVNNVEELGDALDNLGATIGQLGQGLLIDVSPAATETVNQLIEAVRGLQGLRPGEVTGGLFGSDKDNYYENLKENAASSGVQTAVFDAVSSSLRNDERIGGLSAAEQAAADKRVTDSLALEASGKLGSAQDSLAAGVDQGKAIGDISKRFGQMLGGALTPDKVQDFIRPGAEALSQGITSVLGEAERRGEIAKEAEKAAKVTEDPKLAGPRLQLNARTAGDIDTYAAARRNLSEDTAKTHLDIAKKQLHESRKTREALAKRDKPQVFTLAGVT